MSDSERLKKIIDLSGMSSNSFGKHIGLKNSQPIYDVLKGRNGISKDMADKITAKCVNLNLSWILTGEGNMLRNSQQNVDFVPDNDNFEGNLSNINHPKELSMNTLNEMLAVIGRQSKQIGALISQQDRLIGQQEELISEIKRSGSRADRMIDMIEGASGFTAPKKEAV